MENLKRWSILIAPQANNERFLGQIAHLANEFLPQSIHFIFTDDKEELPKELLVDLPDLLATEASEKYRFFLNQIKLNFHPDHKIEVKQLKTARLGQVLKTVADLETDLLIIEKNGDLGLRSLRKKITRKTGASVLLLDPDDRLDWQQIVLPVDFSVYSILTTKIAKEIQLTKEMTPTLNFMHVYQDGSRYLNQVFETVEEVKSALKKRALIDEKLERYANSKMAEFLDSHFTKSWPAEVYEYGRDTTVAEVIKEKTANQRVDLMVLGSKGKGKSLASLMGNTADEFVKGKESFSVLVIKQAGENKSFLRSLLP